MHDTWVGLPTGRRIVSLPLQAHLQGRKLHTVRHSERLESPDWLNTEETEVDAKMALKRGDHSIRRWSLVSED